MTLLGHVLDALAIGLTAVLLRGVFLLVWPYRPCRWCRPGGPVGGSWPSHLLDRERERKGRVACWRCRGSRITRRLGAGTAHRVKLVLTEAWQEREFWR